MKSLQDYINTYRNIANSLNIRGDSAELLIQLLANASYISEVENISYSQEASLERATLINSKIQHCVDNMYSVYRGKCPRVILNVIPQKHITLNPYDELIASNSFKVYYLGYYDEKSEGNNDELIDYESGVHFTSLTIRPGDNKSIKIVGLIAKEVVEEDWDIKEDTYYLDCSEENLSNDLVVTIDKNKNNTRDILSTTRQFPKHILDNIVFDLTLPSFGSRLYISGTNGGSNWSGQHNIEAKYFKYSTINTYNESELHRLAIKGFEKVEFDIDWKAKRNLGNSEITTGIIIIPESSREVLGNIHYRANQDRYLSTIFRTNSDLGTLFEESFPESVYPGGINTILSSDQNSNNITIYYIPKDSNSIISESKKTEFIEQKKAYYITDQIDIEKGSGYDVVFNIEVELFQGNTDNVDEEIGNILSQYDKKFNINFLNTGDIKGSDMNLELTQNSVFLDIQTLISKISSIKRIRSISLDYLSPTTPGEVIYDNEAGTNAEWNEMIEALKAGKAYYNINHSITKII